MRRLLGKAGFSLRVNVKRFTGPPHPDRDKQFRYLRREREAFQRAGDPVLSVDTKKKELVGEFKNDGRTWRRTAREVNAHDFPQDAQFRAAPYGIYDLTDNCGHVHVGMDGDTPQFAVDAIRHWWRRRGRWQYPRARRLMIEADSGGSNGCRPRLWKYALQRWADEDGLTITVAHYPTGASKWNPVEHRLFGPISINWAGEPLDSLDKMLGLIRGVRTQNGIEGHGLLHRQTLPAEGQSQPARLLADSTFATMPHVHPGITPSALVARKTRSCFWTAAKNWLVRTQCQHRTRPNCHAFQFDPMGRSV